MKVKESTIEKKENLEVKEKKEQGNALPKRVEKTKSDVLAIFSILVLIFITIILIITVAFTYINTKNTKIYNGIYIKGINISNLKWRKIFSENFWFGLFDFDVWIGGALPHTPQGA